MKKLIIMSVLLCVLASMCFLPSCSDNSSDLEVSTERQANYTDKNDIGYTVLEDGTLEVTASGEKEKITIPKSYKGLKVSSIGRSAFKMTDVRSVTIPDTITDIGDFAFAFSKLEEITIPNSVTSIGVNAFSGCTNLSEIKLPDSLKTIEIYAFDGSGLEEITLPKNLTEIGQYAFAECPNLKKVTFLSKDVEIPENVFDRSDSVKISAPPNSTAITMAKKMGIDYSVN